MLLTDEQRARIETNRKRALELQKQHALDEASKAKKAKIGSYSTSMTLKSTPTLRQVSSNLLSTPMKTMSVPSLNQTSGNVNALRQGFVNTSTPMKSTNIPILRQNPVNVRAQPKSSATTNLLQGCKPVNATSKSSSAAPLDPLQGYKPKTNVKFEVCSPTSVMIKANSYVNDIKNLIGAYKSAKYIAEKKAWTIELNEYASVVAGLRNLKTVQCVISGLPPWVKPILANNKVIVQTPEDIDEQLSKSEIELCLLAELFPYQRAGVAFGLQKQGRLLIADEMGLGKSLQALAIARAYPSEWPLLIACPSSVKYSWKQQIEKFLPGVRNITVIEKGSDRLPIGRAKNVVIIMSYEQMANRLKELLAANIRVIIFDESHLLKEKTAKRTKAAIELAAKASRRILLSGTPALSRPCELFTQIGLVDSKIFPTWKGFTERYCDLKMGRYGLDATGATHLDELSIILQHSIMIRRFKKDVLGSLPEKTREILYLSGDRIQNELKALRASREAYTQAESSGDGGKKQQSLLSYFAETGSAKAECVASWVLETYFYESDEPIKILLFAHHTPVLNVFSKRFEQANIKTIRIDGSTKGSDRGILCKRFQEDPTIRVALLSITAAGTGITLTAANKVIFAELFWNPGALFQAEDRAHRVGQNFPVNVTYVLARNTADDEIWPKIQEKIMIIGNLKLNNDKLNQLHKTERVMREVPKNQSTLKDLFTVKEQQ